MGIFTLPEGYEEIKRVDLQKDKKLMIFINLLAVLIVALLVLAGGSITPLSISIQMGNLWGIFVIVLAVVLYMVAHELIHGFFIKRYSGKKAKYGFTGIFAYAGSDAFFNRRQYLVIALAPVVIFGTIFLLLNIFLPAEWFWRIYLLQIVNIGGAAGDLYITYLMGKMPADVLTTDEGVAMILYSRTK